MNQRLGITAKEEICTAMTGLAGAAAKAEAIHLGGLYNVSWQYVYRITQHLRHGKRKRRADTGRKRFDIVEGTDTFEAASLVLGAKLDPDQALLTARANGHTDLPTLATFQRILREKGLTRKHRRTGRRNHRRFEAAAPLDIVQIDCTALKVRWQDIRTRRILRIEGIDKNHPQLDQTKLRVWQIMAVDDHSRRRFLRYVVCHHITSRHMVAFCCELFCEWGLPLRVYTDNGPEFKGFFAKAARIIASIPAISESGGYEHFTHAPGNPQASGKVEVAHQWAEKMDRYIGLAEQRGLAATGENLNAFADSICRSYNETRVHRTTGQSPIARWFGTQVTRRLLPREVIQSALLFDEAERVLTETMTVRVGNLDYRIPARDADGKPSPFRVGMRLSVVVPHELPTIFVTLENGDEYDIDKSIATADAAGEFQKAAESEAEQISKQLKKHHTARNSEYKKQRQLTGEAYQIPHFNHEVAEGEGNVRHFPHPEIAVTAEELAAVVPVPAEHLSVSGAAEPGGSGREGSADVYTGKVLSYWAAVAEFSSRFENVAAAKEFLRGIFPEQKGTAFATDVAAAVDAHLHPDQKGAKHLRLAG